MATDEELEAKKVNDDTTDKAPEQQLPEKKKKDVATAILERKKAPNRLVVGAFSFSSFRRDLSLKASPRGPIGFLFLFVLLSLFLSLSFRAARERKQK